MCHQLACSNASGENCMQLYVIGIGVLIAVASSYLFIRPQTGADLVVKVFTGRWLYAVALARIVLGAGLIGCAESVRFSQTIAAFGWLMVLAGLVLVVVTPSAVRRQARWFGGLPLAWIRLWLLTGVMLGAFITYAGLS
jgi:hypothetical protein